MATLNFPAAPALDQIHEQNGRRWQWNGRFWRGVSAGQLPLGYTGSASTEPGYTGSIGYTGSRGADGTGVRIVGSVSTASLLPDPYTGDLGDAYVVDDSGSLYVWTGSTWNNIGQIVGPAGPTGYTGSQGNDGSAGYTGSQGIAGSIGFTGSAGIDGAFAALGYTGSQGDTGFTGSKGDLGYTGLQGNIGYTGSQGDLGYTGSQGIDGAYAALGFTGSAGYTGSAGNLSQVRIGSNGATTSGNITPTSDTVDQYNILGLTGTITMLSPSGTPTDGQRLLLRIKDNGIGAITITWTISGPDSYRAVGVTLPATTTVGKINYIGCVYNTQDSVWDVVAVTIQS